MLAACSYAFTHLLTSTACYGSSILLCSSASPVPSHPVRGVPLCNAPPCPARPAGGESRDAGVWQRQCGAGAAGAPAGLRGTPAHELFRQPAHRAPAQQVYQRHRWAGCSDTGLGCAGGRMGANATDLAEARGAKHCISFMRPPRATAHLLAPPAWPIRLHAAETVDVALQSSVSSFVNCAIR